MELLFLFVVLSLRRKCNPISGAEQFNVLKRYREGSIPNRTPLNLSLSLLLQPWGLFVSLFHESQICEGSIRYTGIQSIDSFLGVGTSRMNKITELGS